MNRPFILAAAALLLVGAAPPTIPRYDIDDLCQRSAGRNGGAPAKNLCVRREQDAYDLMTLYWTTYRPETRQRCIEMQKAPLQAYSGLATCLRMLTPENDAKDDRPFRY